MASEHVFLSALQPNTSVTTYGFPFESRIGAGSSVDESSKAQRVQQQVQRRLAEKSTRQYAVSEYGGTLPVKYQTYQPSFSSKSSFMYTGSGAMPTGQRMTQKYGFSSKSAAPDVSQMQRISVGGGSGSFYRDDTHIGGYQGTIRNRTTMTPIPMGRAEMESSMRHPQGHINAWLPDSDAASMASERDATFSRQYTQNTLNGYTSQMRQGGGTMTYQPSMRRSLSGTLSGGQEMTGGDTMIIHTSQSHKGPAYRTINKLNQRNRMSMGSMSGGSTMQQQQMSLAGSTYGTGGFIASGMGSSSLGNLMMQRQSTINRAPSFKSVHSVGRGMDIYDGQEMGASMGNLNGISDLDMPTAVQYLKESDPNLQVLGAAYIQHECYNDTDAKNEVRRYKGISELVKLFNCDNQEVQRYATGATRNLIYENMDNKVTLIEEGGIAQLVEAMKENDDELLKNITGILWNLSSKDNLKEKLAKDTLPELTEKVLIPLSGGGEIETIHQTPSEADIFYNTTGCLRNLSSVNEKTRYQMREMRGLVDSLVRYVNLSLEENKAEDKGVENCMCVLRNLSYQLYNEMPPSAALRLEGPTRDQDSGKGEAIGCFTPQSRKTKKIKNMDLSTFSEVAREPKGMEWLWHPQIIKLYNRVLHQCEINSTTREAAAGALQNITAGEKRWASVLSQVALDHEHMLPVLLDLLRTNNDLELRSLTGFLRNLSRHARDKNDMATKVVNNLVTKLPEDGYQKLPSSEVVVNICGVLNNLVTSSQVAARDITFFDGLTKLTAIKNSHDNSTTKLKAAKAAATVLSNMFQYKKLHKDYKLKGFTRSDFTDLSL